MDASGTMIDKSQIWRLLKTFRRKRAPGQLVVQITDRCNARCPQCGMRITNDFPRHTLSLDHLKQTIDTAAEKGIEVLSFTGGEPLLYLKEVAELISYAGKAGIGYVRTGTNGFLFQGSEKSGFSDKVERIAATLASTPLRNFWISIDSAVPEVHERMRGLPGVIAGIEKALPIFHRYGIYPSANLGINRNVAGDGGWALAWGGRRGPLSDKAYYENCCAAFRTFYRFVIDLGFTMVNSCYPMSVDLDSTEENLNAVYAASSADSVIRFAPEEKKLLFSALRDTIPEFRSRVRIFSPLVSLHGLVRQYEGNESSYPCRGGIDFFFMDSREGNIYPCGYRGNENLGSFSDLDLRRPAAAPFCRQCDWECFRDPSELFGPCIRAFDAPAELLKALVRDPSFVRLWIKDVTYYRACNYFNGRTPPDFERLASFAR